MPELDLEQFLAHGRKRKFAKDEVVFHEGDPGEVIHYVNSGRVAVKTTTLRGDAVTVSILGPGDLFGEMALVTTHDSRTATVTALEPTETTSVGRQAFEEIRRAHLGVTDLLTSILAERLRLTSERLLEALYVPADLRVLRRLLDLASVYDGYRNGIPLRQSDLADMAGTSRATVNRVLREEEQRGHLVLGRGSIRLTNPEEIRRRAGHRTP